ncbi:hypothetical protein Tco_0653757 [Tanacetum coccineum]|uniref:Uncharacterized protein n=1 Tax=Tanacetum coccineum TaxID=301880 RepID=A0ABQ4X1Q0_9ASTR
MKYKNQILNSIAGNLKNVKNIGLSKIAKIVESKNAKHSEPNQTLGSNATDIPSSSSLVMTGCTDCTMVLLDSGTTKLQGLWGMATISWETLLSQGYTTLKDLDITYFLLVNFMMRILKLHFRKTLALFAI